VITKWIFCAYGY